MIAISRTGRLLRRLVRVSCRRPLVTVMLVRRPRRRRHRLHPRTRSSFKTSGRDVLPQNARLRQAATSSTRASSASSRTSSWWWRRAPSRRAKAYAARLVQELRASPVKFHRVSYRIDPKRFEGRQLLYLSTEKLKEIRDKIFDHQEFMESFAGDPSLARLLEGVNTQFAAAFVSNLFDLGLNDKDLPVDTRFLRVLLEQIAARLDRPTPYRSPWGTLFSFGEDDGAGRRLLPLRRQEPALRPGRVAQGRQGQLHRRPAVHRGHPRRRSPSCARCFPSVQAGVTGGPALSNDEMSAAFHDSQVATALAVRPHPGRHVAGLRRRGQAASSCWSCSR